MFAGNAEVMNAWKFWAYFFVDHSVLVCECDPVANSYVLVWCCSAMTVSQPAALSTAIHH